MECIECGKEFHGRPDKKFCSVSCKSRWHNRRSRRDRRHCNYVITALQANYNVLQDLINRDCGSISLNDAAVLGFNAGYVTGHRKGRHQHDEYSCFDIKYYQSSSKIFNIRKSIWLSSD